MRARTTLAGLALLAVLAACGDDEAPLDAGAGTPAGGGGDELLQADTTVLESPEHGPSLCLGGIAESYPPQCGEVPVDGWDWATVDGEESANGTTWGTYHVVGTYDGTTFTLTEVPTAPAPPTDDSDHDFSTPCPEPAGGWGVLDPATTTAAAQDAALTHASAEPDYAGAWLDQSRNPVDVAEVDTLEEELQLNDPAYITLNVQFTGDLARHEAELRELWGGGLCVIEAERTQAELEAVQDGLTDVQGFLSSGIDTVDNVVELGVVHDDGTLQAELDAAHGPGTVRVHSALRPVAEGDG